MASLLKRGSKFYIRVYVNGKAKDNPAFPGIVLLRTTAAETIASTPESARSNQVQYDMRENNSAGPSIAGHL